MNPTGRDRETAALPQGESRETAALLKDCLSLMLWERGHSFRVLFAHLCPLAIGYICSIVENCSCLSPPVCIDVWPCFCFFSPTILCSEIDRNIERLICRTQISQERQRDHMTDRLIQGAPLPTTFLSLSLLWPHKRLLFWYWKAGHVARLSSSSFLYPLGFATRTYNHGLKLRLTASYLLLSISAAVSPPFATTAVVFGLRIRMRTA